MTDILPCEISIKGRISLDKARKVYESNDCMCFEIWIPEKGYEVVGSMGCKIFMLQRNGTETITAQVGLDEDEWVLFCAEISGRMLFCVYMRANRWKSEQ